jgi:S1-C subfamily serine protease
MNIMCKREWLGSVMVLLLLLCVSVTYLGFAQQSSTAPSPEERIIAVYETASPSVVNITSLSYVYYWFLGNVPQQGTGSGFVYDRNGHIVTNYHVVQGADQLMVTLTSGKTYEAQVVGLDSSNDLTVIRIDAGADLPAPLELADSGTLRVGQSVVAIGTPFGLDQTLTTGVVSALGRIIESPEANQFIGEVIQTDAAINPGNSGGPLLNLDGRVIGVNSQILSTSGSSAGIGFAISSNTVRRVVPELIAHGSYPHPWLGIQTLDLDALTVALLRQSGMDLPVEGGVMVTGFDSGSPAERAALRSGNQALRLGRYIIPVGGDIIVAVDGHPVKSMADLTVYLEEETSVGTTIRLTVLRDGVQRTVSVALAARPRTSI